ncbi:MAG: AAA family ATPase [Subdoligranulum sp.]|nr:AAA family ATPase [Subdoligranulum sp.]
MNEVPMSINDITHMLNRMYGSGAVRMGRELPAPEMISTGFECLDAITGGIPRGQIVEIFGEPSTGKTTLALHLARRAGNVLYIDAENGLHCSGGLYVMHPDRLEEALEAVHIAAPAFDAIVIDTVAALPTRDEAAAALNTRNCNWVKHPSASLLSHALPLLVPILQRTGCTLFLINQLRIDPKVEFGNPAHPTGGWACRNYAAIRIETATKDFIENGYHQRIGQTLQVFVLKNKHGAPHGRATLELHYAFGGAVLQPKNTARPPVRIFA